MGLPEEDVLPILEDEEDGYNFTDANDLESQGARTTHISKNLVEVTTSGGDSATGDTNSRFDVETRVYAKRWYILAVFSVLGILQGMIWNSFGPISASLLAVFCPDWSPATIALLGNWGNIMYILPVIPVLWFFETRGLRASMVLTAGMMLVGTALRCLPNVPVATFTWMAHVCAILNGMAGIVIFSAPPAVSSAWFPPNERTTATGIAIVFNNLGNAVSFLMAPSVVPDPPSNGTNGAVDVDVLVDGGNSTGYVCPEVEKTWRELINFRLGLLMDLEAALVAACFVFIVCHFPSKPPSPPSLTSSMQRLNFVSGVKSICMNKKALLMTLSFSLFNGLIASWYSVMDITFAPLLEESGDTSDVDGLMGYIGLIAIIANSVTTILVSAIVDRLRGRMKLVLTVLMSGAISCWVWMCLLCLRVIPFSLPQLYVSTVLASALTYSSGPIFFEFTVELVYPVPEGVVGGFLTCVYNAVGMIFLFSFYIPGIGADPQWIPIAIMSSVSLSLPLMLLVKEEYNRSTIDHDR